MVHESSRCHAIEARRAHEGCITLRHPACRICYILRPPPPRGACRICYTPVRLSSRVRVRALCVCVCACVHSLVQAQNAISRGAYGSMAFRGTRSTHRRSTWAAMSSPRRLLALLRTARVAYSVSMWPHVTVRVPTVEWYSSNAFRIWLSHVATVLRSCAGR
jgi:hypothetical protein